MANRVLTAEFPKSTSIKRAEYDADTNVLTLAPPGAQAHQGVGA